MQHGEPLEGQQWAELVIIKVLSNPELLSPFTFLVSQEGVWWALIFGHPSSLVSTPFVESPHVRRPYPPPPDGSHVLFQHFVSARGERGRGDHVTSHYQ